MSRAQVTLEFLVLAAVLLVFFLALFDAYLARQHAAQDFQERLSAQRVVDDAARHVNRVLASDNSSRAQLRLPSLLPAGQPYTLSRVDRRLELAWDTKSVSALLLTRNMNGSFTAGALHNVTNVNGGVLVGPA